MAHLYVIAGHGAGDSGACGNGYREAERVRALAQRIKDYGGDSVTLHPFADNAYASKAVSKLAIPNDWQIVELHMDSASASARGGHVIINGKYSADQYDKALATLVCGMFPGRSQSIVGRTDLANVNRAAAKGYGYRLVENGFISNADDVQTFNSRLDELAKGYLAAFGIEGGEAPAASAQVHVEEQPKNAQVSSGLSVDGYWGTNTTKALQTALGTVCDGIVSGQYVSDFNAVNNGGLQTSSWRTGNGGSMCIKALQRKIGASADGYFGRNSCKALQAYLGTTVDGTVSAGSLCVKELQRRLNAGTF